MTPDYTSRVEGKYLVVDGIELKLEFGLCSRPSACLARECAKFQGEVFIAKANEEVDPKTKERVVNYDQEVSAHSIMGIMTLEATVNSKLRLRIQNIEGAERLMGRLHMGLTTFGDYYPYFGP